MGAAQTKFRPASTSSRRKSCPRIPGLMLFDHEIPWQDGAGQRDRHPVAHPVIRRARTLWFSGPPAGPTVDGADRQACRPLGCLSAVSTLAHHHVRTADGRPCGRYLTRPSKPRKVIAMGDLVDRGVEGDVLHKPAERNLHRKGVETEGNKAVQGRFAPGRMSRTITVFENDLVEIDQKTNRNVEEFHVAQEFAPCELAGCAPPPYPQSTGNPRRGHQSAMVHRKPTPYIRCARASD